MLLELGSGDRPFEDGRGWVHMDIRELPDIELVGDCTQLDFYLPHEYADEIRAAHLLEHFSHLETKRILNSWRNVLKTGGILQIEVPNLMWQARALANQEPDPSGRHYTEDEIVELIFGGQDYEGNFHKTGFTKDTLEASLIECGFDAVVTDIGQVLVAIAVKR